MSKLKTALSFVLLGTASAAYAAPVYHNVNSAEIGTGTPRNINWTNEAAQQPVWCQTACYYTEVSTAKIAPDSLLTFGPSSWPSLYSTTNPTAWSMVRSTYTPVGTTDSQGREIVYDSAYWERAGVEFVNATDKALKTQVFQSGNQASGVAGTASAAAAYHVKAQNQSSTSRDFFIRFTAPKETGGVTVPFVVGGPSGSQNQNVVQKKYAKSSSAVDVLVNGLPVWQTSSSYVIPEEPTASSNYNGYTLDFGSASDNDAYTVFVGRFASGESFDLDFIVRAESFSRAPTCGTVNESALYPNPRSFKHCLWISENRTLPFTSAPTGHFEIYSKDISTPVLVLQTGGLGL